MIARKSLDSSLKDARSGASCSAGSSTFPTSALSKQWPCFCWVPPPLPGPNRTKSQLHLLNPFCFLLSLILSSWTVTFLFGNLTKFQKNWTFFRYQGKCLSILKFKIQLNYSKKNYRFASQPGPFSDCNSEARPYSCQFHPAVPGKWSRMRYGNSGFPFG